MRNFFASLRDPKLQALNKKYNLDKIAWYMTLFKTGDYTIFNSMPVHVLEELINWKIEYEKTKKEQAEKEIQNQKAKTSKSSRSSRRPTMRG